VNKDSAIKLKAFAQEIADRFSHKDREKNFNKEDFHVHKITVLSDTTASIIYLKEPSKKFAAAFMYYVNSSGGNWHYFFPTDSHVSGMLNFKDTLLAVERANFPRNFDEIVQEQQLTGSAQ